jgi:hypothetical protein
MSGTAVAKAPFDTREAEELDRQIHRAFDALPVMRLTRAQFGRLWQADHDTTQAVIDRLLASGFLVEGGDGRIGRWPHIGDAGNDPRRV